MDAYILESSLHNGPCPPAMPQGCPLLGVEPIHNLMNYISLFQPQLEATPRK